MWGTAEDVTGLLRETLLSYRLLFGQSKAARRLFLKELTPFAGVPTEGQDPLLASLCGLKKLPGGLSPPEEPAGEARRVRGGEEAKEFEGDVVR